MDQDDFKNFLKKYKFRPNDLLGQNFLMNEFILRDIADASGVGAGDEVLEIGTGIGNLTTLLGARAKFVLSVEKDERYFPILKEQLGAMLIPHTRTPKSSANVQVVFSDIMRFNFQELLEPGYTVVANIPYYITGKIIEMLLTAKNKPARIFVLVQKEVAKRITAGPGDMSILALAVQLYGNAKLMFEVPKENFYPQPEVDSALLAIEVLPKTKIDVDEQEFFRIIRSAFAGKRKQLRNTLKNNLGVSQSQLVAIEKEGKIDLNIRPQELTFDQWKILYDILAKK